MFFYIEICYVMMLEGLSGLPSPHRPTHTAAIAACGQVLAEILWLWGEGVPPNPTPVRELPLGAPVVPDRLQKVCGLTRAEE